MKRFIQIQTFVLKKILIYSYFISHFQAISYIFKNLWLLKTVSTCSCDVSTFSHNSKKGKHVKLTNLIFIRASKWHSFRFKLSRTITCYVLHLTSKKTALNVDTLWICTYSQLLMSKILFVEPHEDLKIKSNRWQFKNCFF